MNIVQGVFWPALIVGVLIYLLIIFYLLKIRTIQISGYF